MIPSPRFALATVVIAGAYIAASAFACGTLLFVGLARGIARAGRR